MPLIFFLVMVLVIQTFFIISPSKRYQVFMSVGCVFLSRWFTFLLSLFLSGNEKISYHHAVHVKLEPNISRPHCLFFIPKAVDYLLDPIPITSAVISFYLSSLDTHQVYSSNLNVTTRAQNIDLFEFQGCNLRGLCLQI